MTLNPQSVAGDETTGFYAPADVRPSDWPRLDPALLTRLGALHGLTATASDVMDEIGLALVVDASILKPRTPGTRIAGQAVTIRSLPERRLPSEAAADGESRLSHHVALDRCSNGDVLVIDAAGTTSASSFGGMATLEATRRGLAGVIVDGAVRDLDEIAAVALPVWSRTVTPRTGKFRLETVQINAPVCCGGHQVVPGDLVLADDTGVCFIPVELADRAAVRILEVATREMDHLEAGRRGSGT